LENLGAKNISFEHSLAKAKAGTGECIKDLSVS